ncbi:hypothetical protein BKA69DRAFT_1080543 [Paraphysoderma sedebokerense]|nr:hypothetical protein BKA69DRAFT_1080543 [Paraphysoderma sedebokerense]
MPSYTFDRAHSYSNLSCIPSVESITQAEFLYYLSFNIPLLIGPSLTATWNARKDWVRDGAPDFDFLRNNFGHGTVDVADCSKRWFNDQEKATMKVNDFIDVWQQQSQHQATENVADSREPNVTENRVSKTTVEHKECVEGKKLYLKDWHFVRDFPEYKAYETPLIFQDDWLNYWFDRREDVKDDYRFVYMGCAGTWTPFHHDVLSSYSWSSNICGKKKWYLFPPNQSHLFKDQNGNTVYDIHNVDEKLFPRFKEAKMFEITQNEGWTLFVPSGWYHQVENMTDAISINHNYCNSFNLDYIFHSLASDIRSIESSISDVRDTMTPVEWDDHVQLLLKCMSGINFSELWCWCDCLVEKFLDRDLTSKTAIDSTELKRDKTGIDNLHAIWESIWIQGNDSTIRLAPTPPARAASSLSADLFPSSDGTSKRDSSVVDVDDLVRGFSLIRIKWMLDQLCEYSCVKRKLQDLEDNEAKVWRSVRSIVDTYVERLDKVG